MMNRDGTIDVAKGLLISLVVLGHAVSASCVVHRFIYLFHMSVFMMVSGYLLQTERVISLDGLGVYVVKKIRRLWCPFFLWTSLFLVLNNLFLELHIYNSDPDIVGIFGIGLHKSLSGVAIVRKIILAVLFQPITTMGCALWFVQVLFWTSIIYASCDMLFRLLHLPRILLHFVMAACGLLIVSKFNFGFLGWIGGGRLFTFYVFYHLGQCLQKVDGKFKYSYFPAFGVIGLICMINIENVDLVSNTYCHWYSLALASLFGWFLTIGAARVLYKFGWIKFIFVFLGKNTLTILILHFLSFKVVTFLYLLYAHLPIKYLAAFPAIRDTNWIWIFYWIAGLAIPCVGATIYDKLLSRIRIKLK